MIQAATFSLGHSRVTVVNAVSICLGQPTKNPHTLSIERKIWHVSVGGLNFSSRHLPAKNYFSCLSPIHNIN